MRLGHFRAESNVPLAFFMNFSGQRYVHGETIPLLKAIVQMAERDIPPKLLDVRLLESYPKAYDSALFAPGNAGHLDGRKQTAHLAAN
jgi:hypothetical protein